MFVIYMYIYTYVLMIGAPSVYMGHEAATHQCLYRKPLGGANLCSFDAARFFDSGCTERREASSRVYLLHYIFILAASSFATHAQPGCRAIAMTKKEKKSRFATIAVLYNALLYNGLANPGGARLHGSPF